MKRFYITQEQMMRLQRKAQAVDSLDLMEQLKTIETFQVVAATPLKAVPNKPAASMDMSKIHDGDQ